MLLAWLLGASVMVIGYFLVEIPLESFNAAAVEAPFNVLQMIVAGVIGIPVSIALRRRIKSI